MKINKDCISAAERLSFMPKYSLITNKEWNSKMITFKSKEKIIQKRDKQIKDWANERIKHWESVYKNHIDKDLCLTEAPDTIYTLGYEHGQESGILDALYQLVEYIDGYRK